MGGKGGLWTLGTGRIKKPYKPGELKLPESRDMEAANRPSLGRKDAELPTEKDQLSCLEESLPCVSRNSRRGSSCDFLPQVG